MSIVQERHARSCSVFQYYFIEMVIKKNKQKNKQQYTPHLMNTFSFHL